MPRVVKPEDHAVKRSEILDAAEHLIYTKGYEQMTVQDLIDTLKISKGAFYHYFRSKQEVLEGLVDRLQADLDRVLEPVVNDTGLTALEKLQAFFNVMGQWKTDQQPVLRSMLRMLRPDENALYIQKVRLARFHKFSEMLTVILQQGIREGVITTASPEDLSQIVVSLIQALNTALAMQLFTAESSEDLFARMSQTIAVYKEATERVLGLKQDTLFFADDDVLRRWVVPLKDMEDTSQEPT